MDKILSEELHPCKSMAQAITKLTSSDIKVNFSCIEEKENKKDKSADT